MAFAPSSAYLGAMVHHVKQHYQSSQWRSRWRCTHQRFLFDSLFVDETRLPPSESGMDLPKSVAKTTHSSLNALRESIPPQTNLWSDSGMRSLTISIVAIYYPLFCLQLEPDAMRELGQYVFILLSCIYLFVLSHSYMNP